MSNLQFIEAMVATIETAPCSLAKLERVKHRMHGLRDDIEDQMQLVRDKRAGSFVRGLDDYVGDKSADELDQDELAKRHGLTEEVAAYRRMLLALDTVDVQHIEVRKAYNTLNLAADGESPGLTTRERRLVLSGIETAQAIEDLLGKRDYDGLAPLVEVGERTRDDLDAAIDDWCMDPDKKVNREEFEEFELACSACDEMDDLNIAFTQIRTAVERAESVARQRSGQGGRRPINRRRSASLGPVLHGGSRQRNNRRWH